MTDWNLAIRSYGNGFCEWVARHPTLPILFCDRDIQKVFKMVKEYENEKYNKIGEVE